MGSVGAPAVLAQRALHASAPEYSHDWRERCLDHRARDDLEEGCLRLAIEAAHGVPPAQARKYVHILIISKYSHYVKSRGYKLSKNPDLSRLIHSARAAMSLSPSSMARLRAGISFLAVQNS